MRAWSHATVITADEVGPGLALLRLDVPAAIASTFHSAGQYHRLRVGDGPEAVLAMASAPGETPFEYVVKRAGDGGALLGAATAGGALLVGPAEGHGFPLDAAAGRPLLLVGTGTGFAPLRSVVLSVLRQRQRFGPVTALYGAATPGHLVWARDFDDWAAHGVAVRATVTQPDADWAGRVGRVQAHLEALAVDDAVAFLCGQAEMVRDVRGALERRGLPAGRIFLNHG